MLRPLANNCGLKLAAMVIAALLFSYVYSYLNYRVTQTYTWPVELRGLKHDLALAGFSSDVERVRVRVTGPVRSMRQLALRRVTAYIDCSNVSKAGELTLRIAVPDLGDIQVTELQPSAAEIKFEQRLTRQFAVAAEQQGTAAAGFVITGEEISPAEVSVSGPRSQVEPLTQALVDFTADPLSGDTTSSLAVKLFLPDGTEASKTYLQVVPERVRYSLSVVPENGVRLLKLVPDFRGELGGDYLLGRTDVKPRFVVVDPALVPPTKRYLRLAPIDLKGASKSFKARVKIDYPFNAAATANLPQVADVDVEVLAFDALAARRLPVLVRGLGPELSCVINPPEVMLRSEELQGLTPDQRASITAVVDLSRFEAGEYRFAPQLALPAGLGELQLDPPTVQVTIIRTGS